MNDFKAVTIFKANRAKLWIGKNSPEILLAGGIAAMLGGTFLACKATVEAVNKKEELEANLANMQKFFDDPQIQENGVYPEEVFIEQRNQLVALFILDLAKLYGPAVVLGALGIGAVIAGNRILNKRNVALMSAYGMLSEAYKGYRERVIKEFGEQVDEYIRFKKEFDGDMKIVDAKTKKEIKFDELEADLEGELFDVPSQYAVFFGPDSVQWRKDPLFNETFLMAQEKFANDLLKTRGHVFLNEIFDALGLPRTPEGAVVGWLVADRDGNPIKNFGDPFISFDIHNPFNATGPGPDTLRRDVTKYLLDFNVAGVIFDRI